VSATSPRAPARPLPSISVPPRIRMSQVIAFPLGRHLDARGEAAARRMAASSEFASILRGSLRSRLRMTSLFVATPIQGA
jgi:hypothetical protein